MTISAEASVRKLTAPIAMTVPPTWPVIRRRRDVRVAASAPGSTGCPATAWSPSPGGISGALRTDVYTTISPHPAKPRVEAYVAAGRRTGEWDSPYALVQAGVA